MELLVAAAVSRVALVDADDGQTWNLQQMALAIQEMMAEVMVMMAVMAVMMDDGHLMVLDGRDATPAEY